MTDAYTLPDLPYDYDALEPTISAQVMRASERENAEKLFPRFKV